jgi:hypothetical protein
LITEENMLKRRRCRQTITPVATAIATPTPTPTKEQQ